MYLRGISFGTLLLIMSFAAMAPATAQDSNPQVSSTPILVVDSDRVFRASNAGKQIDADLKTQLAALVTENRRIEAELVAEELALTEQRPTLTADEFRVLANAFDVKVQAIRSAQDAKQRELQQLRASENQTFLDSIAPVLTQIGRERGALAILERRAVLLSAGSIDITDEAIRRINDANGVTPNDDVPDLNSQPQTQSDDK